MKDEKLCFRSTGNLKAFSVTFRSDRSEVRHATSSSRDVMAGCSTFVSIFHAHSFSFRTLSLPFSFTPFFSPLRASSPPPLSFLLPLLYCPHFPVHPPCLPPSLPLVDLICATTFYNPILLRDLGWASEFMAARVEWSGESRIQLLNGDLAGGCGTVMGLFRGWSCSVLS